MIYVFDLDGTLCETKGGDYERSEPIMSRIRYVNELHRQGHRIIVHTARGSGTGTDWEEFTRAQLDRWGLRHHEFLVGKPFGHLYVDDRAMNPMEFFGLGDPA